MRSCTACCVAPSFFGLSEAPGLPPSAYFYLYCLSVVSTSSTPPEELHRKNTIADRSKKISVTPRDAVLFSSEGDLSLWRGLERWTSPRDKIICIAIALRLGASLGVAAQLVKCCPPDHQPSPRPPPGVEAHELLFAKTFFSRLD